MKGVVPRTSWALRGGARQEEDSGSHCLGRGLPQGQDRKGGGREKRGWGGESTRWTPPRARALSSGSRCAGLQKTEGEAGTTMYKRERADLTPGSRLSISH